MRALVLGSVALAYTQSLPVRAEAGDAAARAEAQRIIASARHPWLTHGRIERERSAMEALYASGASALPWTAVQTGREAVPVVLDLLGRAAEKGLDPRDYGSGTLAARWPSIQRSTSHAADVAAFDTGLSLAFMRFLSDVHLGRIDPRSVGFDIDIAPKRLDLAALVRDAAASGRVRETVAAVEPPVPMYRELLGALARYRELATRAPFERLPAIRNKLSPGDAYEGLASLAQRLIALGDLAPPYGVPAEGRYDGELVEAVKRFQARHGLDPDGIVGRATLAALDAPLSARVRQIELALERLRWLPPLPATRALAVNIPEFRLWAFDPARLGQRPAFRMDVVVGRAVPTHRTPIFAERMTYLEFSPYWNVPPGILSRELLPRLRKDPAYLEREDMEIVDASGRVSTVLDEAAFDALERGNARVRQRPGPKTAVGGLKFVFPNHASVYLHDTPERELFTRSRRAFSHGCIRVQDPVKLARFVLAQQPEWTEDAIRAAMTAGKTRFVTLAEAIPVLIFYVTTVVDPDGRILFLPDPYGYDATLARALAARRLS